MKFTINAKIMVISLGLSVSAMSVLLPQLSNDQPCLYKNSANSDAQCLLAEQQNWLSWIKGKSRSTQFHFVDLLELLNRLSPASKQ